MQSRERERLFPCHSEAVQCVHSFELSPENTVDPSLRKWMDFQTLTTPVESSYKTEREDISTPFRDGGMFRSFGLSPEKHGGSFSGKWMHFQELTTFLESSCKTERGMMMFPSNFETAECFHSFELIQENTLAPLLRERMDFR